MKTLSLLLCLVSWPNGPASADSSECPKSVILPEFEQSFPPQEGSFRRLFESEYALLLEALQSNASAAEVLTAIEGRLEKGLKKLRERETRQKRKGTTSNELIENIVKHTAALYLVRYWKNQSSAAPLDRTKFWSDLRVLASLGKITWIRGNNFSVQGTAKTPPHPFIAFGGWSDQSQWAEVLSWNSALTTSGPDWNETLLLLSNMVATRRSSATRNRGLHLFFPQGITDNAKTELTKFDTGILVHGPIKTVETAGP